MKVVARKVQWRTPTRKSSIERRGVEWTTRRFALVDKRIERIRRWAPPRVSTVVVMRRTDRLYTCVTVATCSDNYYQWKWNLNFLSIYFNFFLMGPTSLLISRDWKCPNQHPSFWGHDSRKRHEILLVTVSKYLTYYDIKLRLSHDIFNYLLFLEDLVKI